MPYAIHLFFDTETDQAILSIWQEMVDSGVAPYLGVSGNRPHISLALCEEFNQATCQKQMENWSIQAKPFPISFQSLGIFPAPDAVVFTAPVVTQELLALQREVDGMLDGCCKWPEFDYYRPGHWIPHCTLATEFEEKRLSEVLAIAAHLKLPLNGMACGVGVIEFRPVKNLFAVPLGNK
jgi:2'-5' RNA ligase